MADIFSQNYRSAGIVNRIYFATKSIDLSSSLFFFFIYTSWVLFPVSSNQSQSTIYCKLVFSTCCCCSAYLSSCYRTTSDANLLDDPHSFHCIDYFVLGGIRTCLGVSSDAMFLWISSSCPLNLLLVRSHQAEIIIAKRLLQERNNVTRVKVEPILCDQGRRLNDAFTIRPRCRLPFFVVNLSLYHGCSDQKQNDLFTLSSLSWSKQPEIT